ncbi:MAG: PAS domain S-box protein [Porphyrobacter sp. IPPAS B-1204]|nr:MAG: PAS domain S-box protein [Porphyrobacter sp. IPPAS B-1204]
MVCPVRTGAGKRAPVTLTHESTRQSLVFEIILVPISHGEGHRAVLVRIRDVSAEHAARALRREADARYKTLFDAIDEGFCIVQVIFDPEGRPVDYLFLEANRAFVEHTGFTEPVGKTMRSFEPEIENQWAETYGRIARSGVAERFESESAVMGRWFDVFAFPIGDGAPHLVGILFEDVGERKRMEIALRHSENRLHSLIEATSDLIFRINPEGTLMEQVGGKPLLGPVDEASNWIADFVPDSDRQAVQEALDTAIDNRQPLAIEHRVRTVDGAISWLSSRAVPVLDEDGTITEWFGMATDITQRRHTEQQLAHGAQMLRMASEIGKVGLWDWNVETGEVVWSDEHFRMHGYEPGAVVPTFDLWAERVHPDDRATTDAKLAAARDSGEEYVNEHRICHPDGEIRWLSARGRFLYDERREPVRMLGAMVDITERRREEEWQKLLVAELQHRVRNLIGMVRSVARLSAPSHRHVDDYVDHLIGRLQAMGRTQSTLTRSPGRNVDLAELVSEELLVHAAQPHQYHIDGPAVALSPHAAEIVTLAIHELATNSIKYGALGDSGYIRIVWAIENRDDTCWISLRWQETSPPRKSKAIRKGFGRRLIEERVPYELDGKGRFSLHDTGVLAELEFPLTDGGSILETRS